MGHKPEKFHIGDILTTFLQKGVGPEIRPQIMNEDGTPRKYGNYRYREDRWSGMHALVKYMLIDSLDPEEPKYEENDVALATILPFLEEQFPELSALKLGDLLDGTEDMEFRERVKEEDRRIDAWREEQEAKFGVWHVVHPLKHYELKDLIEEESRIPENDYPNIARAMLSLGHIYVRAVYIRPEAIEQRDYMLVWNTGDMSTDTYLDYACQFLRNNFKQAGLGEFCEEVYDDKLERKVFQVDARGIEQAGKSLELLEFALERRESGHFLRNLEGLKAPGLRGERGDDTERQR